MTATDSSRAPASEDAAERPELSAPKRGRVFRLLQPILTYVLTNVTVTLLVVFFRVFNRTTVIGRKNVSHLRNTLLLSNHQSMIDSFLVGIAAFYPHSWWRPWLIPWNPAAVENFYKNPFLAWWSDIWKCLPIREGRRDLHALKRMIQLLPTGVMTLFPEGTRMRTDVVGPGRTGGGMLILSTQPTVVPVAIDGMQDVLPIGRTFPRFFKRIVVVIGERIDYRDLLEHPRNKETYQELVDRAMERINALYAEARRVRGRPPPGTGQY